MRKQRLEIVLGYQLHHQAAGIVGVPEISGAADTGGHTHRQLPNFQAVQAKMALSGIADRRMVVFSVPPLCIFVIRFMVPL